MILCDYCKRPAQFVDSARVYRGKSYGMIWDCRECDAYVGVHKGSSDPLGRLANKELRVWKMRAHAAFDKLWRDGKMQRREAYRWLSQAMNLRSEETHIGMFDEQQCERVCHLSYEISKPREVAGRHSRQTDFSLPICVGGSCPPPWVACGNCVAQRAA